MRVKISSKGIRREKIGEVRREGTNRAKEKGKKEKYTHKKKEGQQKKIGKDS